LLVTAIGFENDTVFWRFDDGKRIELGSFVINEKTVISSTTSKFKPSKHDLKEGDWSMIYCTKSAVRYFQLISCEPKTTPV